MNWTNIIVAVLALIGTLAGAYLANRRSAVLIAYRIEELEKRVNKHNNVIERMYRLEERTASQEEKIQSIAQKVDDIVKK